MRQDDPVFPATVSPSQCPITLRLFASCGRSSIGLLILIFPLVSCSPCLRRVFPWCLNFLAIPRWPLESWLAQERLSKSRDRSLKNSPGQDCSLFSVDFQFVLATIVRPETDAVPTLLRQSWKISFSYDSVSCICYTFVLLCWENNFSPSLHFGEVHGWLLMPIFPGHGSLPANFSLRLAFEVYFLARLC